MGNDTTPPRYDHPPERNPNAPFTLPPHVIDDIARGSDSEAIRLIRKATGVGDEEARDIVAEIRREIPKDRVASRGATASTGLAPGQVAPGAGPAKWVALLVVAALAVFAALYLR